ncbi:hypothetical protein [Microbacter margulisiae]|uniref:Uncharacterized protein n=1 Tax=Microbacter margulisiae TaxID=1350067 RepID=A0A7W5H261_9PORP|nr:hypothetical protein [Microbacter margulisiae]MBB3187082.1 hypothetical protein [Microbacter margulisiae]
MKTVKMSLATIQGKLSRTEMKKIITGNGGVDDCAKKVAYCNGGHWSCYINEHGICYNSYCGVIC